MASRTNTKKVTTATLIRGKFYSYCGEHFFAKEPKIVSDELAVDLMEEVDEVVDAEGDFIEKPRFRIETGVDASTVQTKKRKNPLRGSTVAKADTTKARPKIRKRKLD